MLGTLGLSGLLVGVSMTGLRESRGDSRQVCWVRWVCRPAGGCFDDQPTIVAELVWKVEGGSLSCLGALTLKDNGSVFCLELLPSV
mgnify:CR=1 FL=1|jgi:hypothetical protein